jgi:hypothetical protein
MAVNGPALAAAAAAGIFLYSGITGKSVLTTVQYLLSGKPISSVPVASSLAITGDASLTSGQISGGSASGQAIAQDALNYQGHSYVYGGAPGPDAANPWDCSSFASWVLGHDMDMAIPGGSWATVTNNGNSHGPATGSYLIWSGCTTISQTSATAGDLAISASHMGILINSSEMISALNESLGTKVTGIVGAFPAGEVITYRRLKADVS